jgi:major membrane immunogen (membrane-anchored lipoprotein)
MCIPIRATKTKIREFKIRYGGMPMKKKHSLYIICLVLVLVGVSCAPAQPEKSPEEQPDETQQPHGDYEDGVYFANKADVDDHGWKPLATVVVQGSEISKAYFDEINEDDRLKSFDQDYLERWKESSGENLLSAEPELVDALMDGQDPNQVDAVSGATSTSEKFKQLISDVLKESPQPDRDEVYYDGLFKAEGEYDERGWKAYVAVIVEDSKITKAYYDEVNEETGKLKSYDQEYLAKWKENSGSNLQEARQKLVQDLISIQKPQDVDAVSGATSTSLKFKELIEEALTPLVD